MKEILINILASWGPFLIFIYLFIVLIKGNRKTISIVAEQKDSFERQAKALERIATSLEQGLENQKK